MDGAASGFDGPDAALLRLLERLRGADYRFVTITPASHQRVLERRAGESAKSLRDVFGWSLPFDADLLDDGLSGALRDAGVLEKAPPRQRSGFRVSSVAGRLYLHSAFPTIAPDAVFLGPDSYRFANLITAELAAHPPTEKARIVDIGVGAGVGAITAAGCCPDAAILATDVNPTALRLTRINAAANGVALTTFATSGVDGVPGSFDVILLNPPYMMDDAARSYRDGGTLHGGQLSLDLVTAALPRLAGDGRLILYTGSAIIGGEDRLGAALAEAARAHGCTFRYGEIDPDVFGEELGQPQYAEVERIAVVTATIARAG